MSKFSFDIIYDKFANNPYIVTLNGNYGIGQYHNITNEEKEYMLEKTPIHSGSHYGLKIRKENALIIKCIYEVNSKEDQNKICEVLSDEMVDKYSYKITSTSDQDRIYNDLSDEMVCEHTYGVQFMNRLRKKYSDEIINKSIYGVKYIDKLYNICSDARAITDGIKYLDILREAYLDDQIDKLTYVENNYVCIMLANAEAKLKVENKIKELGICMKEKILSYDETYYKDEFLPLRKAFEVIKLYIKHGRNQDLKYYNFKTFIYESENETKYSAIILYYNKNNEIIKSKHLTSNLANNLADDVLSEITKELNID